MRAGAIRRRARPAWDHVTSPWDTAFWKDEVVGAVPIGLIGLEGDQQADRRHHGGPERAVLMYAAAHYPSWREGTGLADMGPGAFGENLTVDGLDETTVCVGDVLEVGGARLQVASPRGPCLDISRRWDHEGLLKRVVATRRTGWYLRVPGPGPVEAGDRVRVVERPHPGWTVDRLLRLRYVSPRRRDELEAAAALRWLDPEWCERFAAMPERD